MGFVRGPSETSIVPDSDVADAAQAQLGTEGHTTATPYTSSGDTMTAAALDLPPGCALIEVHVADLKQMFHSLDPTPFRQRDLDPKAEQFIAEWAREIHVDRPLGLLIHVDHENASDDIATVHDAVREYFSERAASTRRRLRLLFRQGRTSLAIGLLFLAASIVTGNVAENMLEQTRFAGIARESLLIGGWVAMWRPLEVFLYDWWPIRAEARLFDRLSAMTVRVVPSRPN
jgi:hypothetical protein